MKKYSFILLFSFFLLIPNVHAEYYITPSSFDIDVLNGSNHFDYPGFNDGSMTSVYTLNGNDDITYHFEFDLDGSNCGSNIDSSACFDTIHAIEEGGVSSTIYGYFSMCVSKPQFHWSIDWSTCNDNCLQKSQDLVVINNSYKSCTLGLYNTETGTNMTDEGYLVRVYYNIAKWQYIEGAFSGVVNGFMYLHNDSDSVLYYRFVDDLLLSDRNMSSFDSGYGIFNHDYSQPDLGGETFLNNGTCVMSYNKMNNYNISTWSREDETLTFNNTLLKTREFTEKNLLNLEDIISQKVYITNISNGFNVVNIGNGPYRNVFPIEVVAGKTYTVSFDYNLNNGTLNEFYIRFRTGSGGGDWLGTRSNFLNPGHIVYHYTATQTGTIYLWLYYNSSQSTTPFNLDITKLQVEFGNKATSYKPYYGYNISYDNFGGTFNIFKWYDTNLNSPGVLQYKLTSYSGRTKVGDLVNCPGTNVCRFENELYFSGSFTSLFNDDEQKIKKIEFQLLSSSESIYFKNPYIYNLYDVPGRLNWVSYYQPANTYICSDNDNGTYYNAMSKKVYYNPAEPPSTFSSNVNSDYQNIFGQTINFYGLTDIFNFPIQIITRINNGEFRNCQPLHIPFPGFVNKYLDLPCYGTYLWNNFPSLKEIYNTIIIGILSIKVSIGTINYIKKWYTGDIESEDL